MEMLIRDSREQHLLMLDDLLDVSHQTGEDVIACASCYQPIQICTCSKATAWPLEHVINKLRAELSVSG